MSQDMLQQHSYRIGHGSRPGQFNPSICRLDCELNDSNLANQVAGIPYSVRSTEERQF